MAILIKITRSRFAPLLHPYRWYEVEGACLNAF
jgi:hypothetical protein